MSLEGLLRKNIGGNDDSGESKLAVIEKLQSTSRRMEVRNLLPL